MLDRDLAEVYGTETKFINRAVDRNPERFPEDFVFQLTPDEFERVRFQNGTSQSFQTVAYAPHAFTREGANMLSAVLKTKVAAKRSVQIMRAFSAMEKAAKKAEFRAGVQFLDRANKMGFDAGKLEELKDLRKGGATQRQAARAMEISLERVKSVERFLREYGLSELSREARKRRNGISLIDVWDKKD